ncbi:MAG TPA: hypothetical protein PK093_12475 [Phycisphaerae bacterium]|nr:hypothetical protein [Phycisphaerae bacterium]
MTTRQRDSVVPTDAARAAAGRPRVRVAPHAGRRCGYVLIIVLGLAVVAFSVATAFLEAHASVLTEAENLMASSRASYLAGSGVDIACHYLLYPPDDVADGSYWPGARALRIDSTNDFINVAVTQDATLTDVYQIDAFGFAMDNDGEARGKRGVRAKVKMRPDSLVEVPYAALCGDTLTASSSVRVIGPVHANGAIVYSGDCTGTMSSTGLILWLSLSAKPTTESYVDAVPMPTIDVSAYTQYIVNGSTCNAYYYDSSSMDATEAGTLNGILDADTDNPGRIVVVKKGDLTLESGLTFYGTLVVDGDLKIKDSGARQLTAVANYPAIVCSGSIRVETASAGLSVYGATLCQTLNGGNKKNASVSINGALIATDSEAIENEDASGASVTLTYNSHYAKFYDFRVSAMPYTLISWSDY